MGAARRPALLLGATRRFPASGRKNFFGWIRFVAQLSLRRAIRSFRKRAYAPWCLLKKNLF